MTRQSRELISVSRTLKSFRFVEHSVTKNQELQENVISVKWHQAALGFGLLLLLSIWKQRGRSAWEHWRIFINWDGVISVPTVAWPLFPAALLGFASDYVLQGNRFPFLPPFLRCSVAVQVCSVNFKPSPFIKPPVRVLSLIWLHHDRQHSRLTWQSPGRDFPSSALTGPVKHWHCGKRMMKFSFVNTKLLVPWLSVTCPNVTQIFWVNSPWRHFLLAVYYLILYLLSTVYTTTILVLPFPSTSRAKKMRTLKFNAA